MKKAVLIYLALVCMLGSGSNARASQGLSVNEQILSEYRNAKTFQEFVEKLSRASFAGDIQYVQKVWEVYPELLKDTSLPKFIFEDKQFLLKEGSSEAWIQVVENQHYQFLINGQKLIFRADEPPAQRMKKILQTTKSRKTAHFVSMPVAWAAEQGQPGRFDLGILAVLNYLMKAQGPKQAK